MKAGPNEVEKCREGIWAPPYQSGPLESWKWLRRKTSSGCSASASAGSPLTNAPHSAASSHGRMQLNTAGGPERLGDHPFRVNSILAPLSPRNTVRYAERYFVKKDSGASDLHPRLSARWMPRAWGRGNAINVGLEGKSRRTTRRVSQLRA